MKNLVKILVLVPGAGIDINNLQTGLNYSLGLANISEGETYGNRVFSISVGYRL